jgi:hypothetical protein
MKIITTLAALATGAGLLTGCGGGSSSPPTPTPTPHTITVTNITIDLSHTSCESDSSLVNSETYTGPLYFGAQWQTSSGAGISLLSYSPYNFSTEDTSDTVYYEYQLSFGSQPPFALPSIDFAVGDGGDIAPYWDGGTDLVCLNSSGDQVHINFKTLDQNGNVLSQTTNISNLTADYTGPITFQAYDLPASGIYLFDPNNPKAHADQTILNNKNQL